MHQEISTSKNKAIHECSLKAMSYLKTQYSSTNLVIIIKDAAEVEETCRTKVCWYLLRFACAGHMYLWTVHHPKVSRDLKGALGLGLCLRRQCGGLGCLDLSLFCGFLLTTEGHKYRLLLLLRLMLLLLRKGIVRPCWLHTMGDSGCRCWEVGHSIVWVCNAVRENRRRYCGEVWA